MTMSKSAVVVLASLAVVLPARAQVFKLTRDQMIQYTANNPFDRFPDGRPKVPDSILERVKGMSAEEVFGIEEQGFPEPVRGQLEDREAREETGGAGGHASAHAAAAGGGRGGFNGYALQRCPASARSRIKQRSTCCSRVT